MEERISGIEDITEEMVKENVKPFKIKHGIKHVQEIQDTMKRSILRIIGIEEDRENIFNKS